MSEHPPNGREESRPHDSAGFFAGDGGLPEEAHSDFLASIAVEMARLPEEEIAARLEELTHKGIPSADLEWIREAIQIARLAPAECGAPSAFVPMEGVQWQPGGGYRTSTLGTVAVALTDQIQLRQEMEMPAKLGRYVIISELGRGGFGMVYLADDELLDRRVAVKVLKRRPGMSNLQELLKEARALARLNHPGIVAVFDAFETDGGDCCLVSRYVEGPTLARRIMDEPLTQREAVACMVALCEALEHAHGLNFVHRDVKPGNIIIGADRRPVLLDFGLATLGASIQEDRTVGTPPYMSPEQARGEDHLVDCRSDVFSAGSILYELLTGQRVFGSDAVEEVLERVRHCRFKPPRQVNPQIPMELERICLRALHERPKDRYATAEEMRSDLDAWLRSNADIATSQAPRQVNGGAVAPWTARISTRGLRMFEQDDADFFLALLPGPRDRSGLPESVRFWKRLLECTDLRAARICVLYGPSGSGKSSFVRAGVLPVLGSHVKVVRLDAGEGNFELKLLQELQGIGDLGPFETAAEALMQVRRGAGIKTPGKLLLVIDQSEHLFRRNAAEPASPNDLPAILRQCDGSRVQAMLIVRDDFWRGLTILLESAGASVGPENSALIDLFDIAHARFVLELNGRALGLLPADSLTPLSSDATAFLDEAASGLAQVGLVSPARLALFTQFFRVRPWTPASLTEIGGLEGFGLAFLEDSFRGAAASSRHRSHVAAATAVLSLMIPAAEDVREPPVPEARLLEASGYAGRPRLFEELMGLLDRELRLITPVEIDPGNSAEPAWQLTHDQLIPTLREWLHVSKGATLRGRSRIRLRERAAEFALRPRRNAAGIFEWLRFNLLTPAKDWSANEKRFMAAAKRRGLTKLAALCVCTGVGSVGLHSWQKSVHDRAAVRELFAVPSRELVAEVGKLNDPARLLGLIRRETNPKALIIRTALGDLPAGTLQRAMLEMGPADFAAAVQALNFGNVAPDIKIWEAVLQDAETTSMYKLRAAAGLAAFKPSSVPEGSAASWLLASGSEGLQWATLLGSIADKLAPDLRRLINDAKTPAGSRQHCSLLAAASSAQPDSLIALLEVFPAEHLDVLFLALKPHGDTAVAGLRRLLETIHPPSLNSSAADSKERRTYLMRASAAVLLTGLGAAPEVGGFTLQRSSDRTERTLFTLACAQAGIPPSLLTRRLRTEPDPGVRFALLLALGGYAAAQLSENEMSTFLEWINQSWLQDPDGGCHSSLQWLLREWGLSEVLTQLQERTPRLPAPAAGFSWWVTPAGIDMRIVDVRDTGRVAIAATEFVQAGDTDGVPIGCISWGSAVEQCLTVSRLENIPDSALAYARLGQSYARTNSSASTYRLPSRKEWTTAATLGTQTYCEAGAFEEFMLLSAWFAENSQNHVHPTGLLRPSDTGIFDLFGNVDEWMDETNPDISDQGWAAGRRGGHNAGDALRNPISEVRLTMKSAIGFQGFRLARNIP